jgi:prepilin-type N-terminal cleavage/methylation domain-containing protein
VRGRGGWSLLEVVVSLALMGLLAAAAAGAVEGHRRALSAAIQRGEEEESLRVVRGVLREELAVGRTPVDWTAAGDSIALRAWRGWAVVCPAGSGAGDWRVASGGIRRLDPSKDSIQVLGVDGRWRALLPTWVSGRPAGCQDPDGSEWWRAEALPEATPVFVRVHERGTYLLADGALRYRRGRGGRQPLTPLFLGEPAATVEVQGGGLQLLLELESGRRVEGWVEGVRP